MKTLNKVTKNGIEKIRDVYERKDITSKTKAELIEICDTLDLSTTGTKEVLIDRILNH